MNDICRVCGGKIVDVRGVFQCDMCGTSSPHRNHKQEYNRPINKKKHFSERKIPEIMYLRPSRNSVS